jgi:hypothetical protein
VLSTGLAKTLIMIIDVPPNTPAVWPIDSSHELPAESVEFSLQDFWIYL